MKRDESTYERVGRHYDEYTEIVASRPAPPARPPSPRPPQLPKTQDSTMGRTVFAAIGFGIGAILLLLAILSFATAAKWSGLDRESAMVGYSIVGFFLTLSGVGGILATYNHNFRVLAGRSAAHH